MLSPWTNTDIASNGRAIHANFHAWFGNSKAVDEQGAPKTLYHGTFNNFDAFELSDRDFGIHFGSPEQTKRFCVKERAKYAGLVLPVHLKVENPLRIKDAFAPGANGSWSLTSEFYEKGLIDKKVLEDIRGMLFEMRPFSRFNDTHRLTLINSPARGRRVRQILNTALRHAGHDGLVYENRYEYVRKMPVDWSSVPIVVQVNKEPSMLGSEKHFVAEFEAYHHGCGATAELAREEAIQRIKKRGGVPVYEDSWVVLDPCQIKSATGNCGLYLQTSNSLTDLDADLVLKRAQQARMHLHQEASLKTAHLGKRTSQMALV